MIGWQAEGAAPIVTGKVVENPQSVASAIRIGNPASWRLAEAARDESGGEIKAVSDDEILEAYRLLAQEEGIFCEPASAACVAGLFKYASNRRGGRPCGPTRGHRRLHHYRPRAERPRDRPDHRVRDA